MRWLNNFLMTVFVLASWSQSIFAEKPSVIYRPVFETSEGTVDAGTAFVILHNNKYFIVSAQHLIGTAGGLDRDFLGSDLPRIFHKVSLKPVQNPNMIINPYKSLESSKFVLIADAKPIGDETAKYDLFVSPLAVANMDTQPMMLAKERPKPGDRVTLYAAVSNTDKVFHFATVARYTQDQLVYIFDDKSMNLRATSGAPVLNKNGEVVGINLAGGETKDGRVVGFANPYESILRNLVK